MLFAEPFRIRFLHSKLHNAPLGQRYQARVFAPHDAKIHSF